MDRTEYLNLFRSVASRARQHLHDPVDSFLTHNHISLFDDAEFDEVFAGVISNKQAIQYLPALRILDCLPDRRHWERRLPKPDPERDWSILAHAVVDNFDHQSEKSTDIRWMKLAFAAISGKIVFPESLKDRVEEYRLYPDKGDMKAVRPSIRAAEMSLRQFEFEGNKDSKKQLPEPHQAKFWTEMKTKTQCVIGSQFSPPVHPPKELAGEVSTVFHALQNHFDETISTTGIDARHDGAFGLALYAVTILLDAAISPGHGLAEGRMMLRAIVEVFITLKFLSKKDSSALWTQYRKYGSGQAKLAFLKNVREKEIPEFFDLKLIEALANEDMWMEYQDIKVGNWANLTVRKMAEEGGTKSLYDKYYDWASGYSHAHWICVRDTVFVNCMNPLHRFHRIPGPPIANLPTILPDACKLVNGVLDEINSLYPTFKPRLTWHKKDDPAQ